MAQVLPVQLPDGQAGFRSSLRKSSPSQSSFLVGSPPSCGSNKTVRYGGAEFHEQISTSLPSSTVSSPTASQVNLAKSSSFHSVPSVAPPTSPQDDEKDTNITFPMYDDAPAFSHSEDLEPPASPKTENSYTVPSSSDDETASESTSTPDTFPTAGDDTSIKPEPQRHVDYLSHDWKEEEIWSSWRHIVSKRRQYGQLSRLENASWRTWAKAKYKLKTVSPETLNWLKDYDVTWLYGPLQTPSTYALSEHRSEPTSNLSKNNSFINKKPILKKRSMSEVMLQRSISASSLVKQAAAAVQAQQDASNGRVPQRPPLGRTASDFVGRTASDFVATPAASSKPVSGETTDYFSSTSASTSGLQSPSEKRHIRFDDKVEQCIAVDVKEGDEDEDEEPWKAEEDDDSSSDDGVVMMKTSKKAKPLSRSNSRGSFSNEGKTIAMLPSTRLKYRTDSPDIPDDMYAPTSRWRGGKLSPSPSQETLRPSRPSTNFLLGEDDQDDEDGDGPDWQPSRPFPDRRDSVAVYQNRLRPSDPDGRDPRSEESESSGGLRRTESGMFMPYEDDEQLANAGIFGKVVDTVNTARDIAHVIWNVGWRK
ncbi:hypothetical protein BDY21DRAFT_361872 [Lineolata rhizophorae]|uniref:Nitrogen regulatory protein areA GATA-like domain-containing protein n=1 Tax=Lineolata rhizophorae TaxID=578093 RepID=A0A6A6P7M1_9PEZI|nr:hypothetical protein BDY21DRAFT_361872 [Lineolata rhizophorae]